MVTVASQLAIRLPWAGISQRWEAGVLFLEGELPCLAAKKRVLARAARIAGIAGIVDRLRVRPSRPMTDGALVRRLADALLREPALAGYGVCGRIAAGPVRPFRCGGDACGTVAFTVRGGVVVLDGAVAGLREKCLAGVLAWRLPGTREVVNRLAAASADGFDTGAAVRLVLDGDLGPGAAGIRVAVRHGVVHLSGAVGDGADRERAETDCWLVPGVERVVNRIVAAPGA